LLKVYFVLIERRSSQVIALIDSSLIVAHVPADGEGSAFGSWGIYASLAAQAASGFAASYLWGPAAGVHEAVWNLL
jgi:hypothetical protein